jgi:ribosomal protein S18 acetylase RimI-like enzyme
MALTVLAPASLEIRIATREDVPALRGLKRAVVAETWGRDHDTADVDHWLGRFAVPGYFAARIDAGPDCASTFFVVGPPDVPTGMAALKVRDGRAYIGDVYVAQRGQGIGRRLLGHALEEAKGLGLPLAMADVFDGNQAALHLLRAHGFRKVEEYTEPSLRIAVSRLAKSLGA